MNRITFLTWMTERTSRYIQMAFSYNFGRSKTLFFYGEKPVIVQCLSGKFKKVSFMCFLWSL